jgi:hypothetical protein
VLCRFQRVLSMFDFLIGLAFVLMVIGPVILATVQRSRSQDHSKS